jgi:hypothetical protein
MAAPNPEKKTCGALSRLLWAVSVPWAGYMSNAKPGGEKRCEGSATTAKRSNSFSNKL